MASKESSALSQLTYLSCAHNVHMRVPDPSVFGAVGEARVFAGKLLKLCGFAGDGPASIDQVIALWLERYHPNFKLEGFGCG